MKKAAFHNLGCKVNSYETEAMQQILEAAGYEIVPFQEKADVYVINTCSVTNIADRKSRQMLHKAKKMNPDSVVVAAGCYVQAAAEELRKDAAIDIVIGNNKKTELADILADYFMEKEKNEIKQQDYVIDIAHTNEYENLSIDKISEHTRAFIKVQDGCNQFCSYCIIPYTRGRVRSRAIESVVSEVKMLVSKGYSEIVLTGIHLSSYGVDFAENRREDLTSLIVSLNEIENLRRIRLGSLEPRIVTEEFAKTLAEMEKICPHFHLSLQSGCDETLKRMNRRYTTAEYMRCCNILRKYFKNPAITTDVIVGFPGETEDEFKETVSFLEKVNFYEMHVFKYSKRAGTKAAQMPDQIPEQEKSRRSEVLISLGKEMSKKYRESFIGEEKEILLEEKTMIAGNEYIEGHTKEYIKAVIPYKNNKKGSMVSGVITDFLTEEIMILDNKI